MYVVSVLTEHTSSFTRFGKKIKRERSKVFSRDLELWREANKIPHCPERHPAKYAASAATAFADETHPHSIRAAAALKGGPRVPRTMCSKTPETATQRFGFCCLLFRLDVPDLRFVCAEFDAEFFHIHHHRIKRERLAECEFRTEEHNL